MSKVRSTPVFENGLEVDACKVLAARESIRDFVVHPIGETHGLPALRVMVQLLRWAHSGPSGSRTTRGAASPTRVPLDTCRTSFGFRI
jgi:hypothetical protein